MTIVARSDIGDLPHKQAPLAHHKLGLQWTRSGYGKRIPSTWMVQLPDSPRWRRVYVCCYSNSGTAYVEVPGGWHVITGQGRDTDAK